MPETRRVVHLPAAGWIAVSLAIYVVLGVLLKSPVLNWVVGPLWLFGTLYAIPVAVRALRRRAVER